MLDWSPIILTFKLAIVTTLILLLISIPIANWLVYTKSRLKVLVEVIATLPLVLPPTVLGFYLLIAFSPESFIGSLIKNILGIELIFSFEGIVLASVIYSLPFMLQPLYSGLKNLPDNLREASYTLGKSHFHTLIKVLLPNIKSSIITAITLTFAHTIGEFGVIYMIGGSIPGKTKVASIAIYEEVELLHYENANIYSLTLLSITFIILLTVFISRSKTKGRA